LFDEDGKMAASGKVNEELLNYMKEHPYFQAAPPKTTGRETFTQKLLLSWKEYAQVHLADKFKEEDFVATLTELTAWSIAISYVKWGPNIERIIVSGGGSRNGYLMKRIETLLAQELQLLGRTNCHIPVLTHDEAVRMNSDGKEAFLFAVLGYHCVLGKPANIPACTGAKEAAVLGKINPGKNYHKLLRAFDHWD
jgi:anhydro-N-acetylmuramic acid kinase